MSSFGASITTIIGLFVTVAIISVLVSKNAQTSTVFTAFGTAVSSIIGAAVKPVSS